LSCNDILPNSDMVEISRLALSRVLGLVDYGGIPS
jgi:hypothetical protein